VSNAVLAWQATPGLKLHTHLTFESKQTSYNTDLVKVLYISRDEALAEIAFEAGRMDDFYDYYDQIVDLIKEIISEKEMGARAIVNVGAEYKTGRLTLGLNIHNLLGTKYYRSGMNTNLIPQQGRWWMASVGYRL
jgi:iron complex outermembrane receptor protein